MLKILPYLRSNHNARNLMKLFYSLGVCINNKVTKGGVEMFVSAFHQKKRYLSVFLIMAFIFFAFTGCSSSREDAAMSEPAMAPDYDSGDMATESAPEETGMPQDEASQERGDGSGVDLGNVSESQHKIIYTGEISMETLDFDETIENITQYVSQVGGYTESSSIEGRRISDSNQQSRRHAYYTFRIPEQRFTGFADQMKEFGNVTSQSTHGENITERYFDTEARLNSLQIQEERLLNLLEQAESIDDIMRIETELSNIRYQVESLTGSLQKWDNLVQFSTIHLSIREVDEMTPDPDDPPGFLSDLQDALQDSILAVIDAVKYLITFIIMAIPFVVVFGSVFLLIRKGYKVFIEPRRKRKHKPTPPEPPIPPSE